MWMLDCESLKGKFKYSTRALIKKMIINIRLGTNLMDECLILQLNVKNLYTSKD